MPVFIVLYLFLVGVAALLAQMELPVMFPVLDLVGIGSALVPLVVIYASLELSDERAPLLAALLGLLLDLNCPPPHRLGVDVLLLTSLSLLIVTQAHKKESAHWITRLTYVLVGTFGYLIVDFLVQLVETRPLALAARGLEQDHPRLALQLHPEPPPLLPHRPAAAPLRLEARPGNAPRPYAR